MDIASVIYADHSATTRPLREVVDAMVEAMRQGWANPSSVHGPGQAAHAMVELARDEVARAAGVTDPRTVVFTSGGTEAAYSAVLGAVPEPARSRVVTTAVEHPSVRAATDHLLMQGCEVDVVGVDTEGRLDLEVVEHLLVHGSASELPGPRRRVELVTMQWANHETGNIHPVAEVAALCRRHGALLHVDAVGAFGKAPVDGNLADLVSLSAHKIHGPKGVGALLCRAGLDFRPLVPGTQERGRRGGTKDVAAIVGFGVACRILHAERERRARHLRAVGAVLEHGLLAIDGARQNGFPAARIAGVLNVSFAGVRAEPLVVALDLEGVAVSAGAACSSALRERSPVLSAMFPHDLPRVEGGVRFSLGRDNTADEVQEICRRTAVAVERLRRAASG